MWGLQLLAASLILEQSLLIYPMLTWNSQPEEVNNDDMGITGGSNMNMHRTFHDWLNTVSNPAFPHGVTPRDAIPQCGVCGL